MLLRYHENKILISVKKDNTKEDTAHSLKKEGERLFNGCGLL